MKKIASVITLSFIGLQFGMSGAIAGISTGVSFALPSSPLIATTGIKQSVTITLTALEAGVIEEHNKVRQNPQSYIPVLKAWRERYKGDNTFELDNGILLKTEEGLKAVDEAIAFLETQKPVPPLKTSYGLMLAAKDHAKDQAEKMSGHTGNDGSEIKDRINRYGSPNGAWGENLSYGSGKTTNKGSDVIRDLIIDDGVDGRGHRSNIFDTDFEQVGVACGDQSQMGNVCVINYASKYNDKPELFK